MVKSPDAFRTISEVADDLDLPQHVLRFWETRFNQIKPMKRGGGRRYYRPDDVELLKGIRHLLYAEGYTIKGVQRILKENGNRFVMAAASGNFDPAVLANSAIRTAAISLADESQPESGEPRKSMLSRLIRSDSSRPAGDDAAAMLGASSRAELQATLMELLECKRILDQVR